MSELNSNEESLTQKKVVGIMNEHISYNGFSRVMMSMNPMLCEDEISSLYAGIIGMI